MWTSHFITRSLGSRICIRGVKTNLSQRRDEAGDMRRVAAGLVHGESWSDRDVPLLLAVLLANGQGLRLLVEFPVPL